jgi:hypothetical protein
MQCVRIGNEMLCAEYKFTLLVSLLDFPSSLPDGLENGFSRAAQMGGLRLSAETNLG